jgi:hypothetical protein
VVVNQACPPAIAPLRCYEARLLDRQGKVLKIYRLECHSVIAAQARLAAIRDVDYVRYELWQGMAKVCEGECEPQRDFSEGCF